jgi:hypothetical protein
MEREKNAIQVVDPTGIVKVIVQENPREIMEKIELGDILEIFGEVDREEDCIRAHKLIKRFGEVTGVPVLLNTSFNDRGEPIVEKPEDGIKYFKNSKIDILCIGNFIVEEK